MSGEEEVKEDVVESTEEEEQVKEETVEEKVIRIEAENAEYAQKQTDWEKREKLLTDERANLGRRNKAVADEKMVAMERQLSQLQSQIAGAGNQADLKKRIEGADLTDPDTMYKLITETSQQIARNEIDTTISRQSEREKQYEGDYEKTIDELGRDLDPETYAAIRENLKGMTSGEYCHTGIGGTDAVTNFQQARADYYEGQINEARKPLNLKQDKVVGAGVGGKGTVKEDRSKPLKLGEEEKKLAASLGRDEKWLKEHGIGVA